MRFLSDRYRQVKLYKTFQFCPDSPIDILKGALYIDNKTNKIVFQLKFINMQNKNIKAIYINVKGFNELGEKLEDKEYSYLDIYAGRGKDFGTKQLKELDDNTIRHITVKIDKVIFEDDSIWENKEEHLVERTELKLIPKKYNNIVVNKLNETNTEIKTFYFPTEKDAYWSCLCGTYNLKENNTCYKCGLNKEKVFKYFNEDSLKKDFEKQEQINKQIKKQKEEEKEKLFKKAKIILPIIFIIIIIILAIFTIYNKINPSAKDVLKEGDYVQYLNSKGTEMECRVLYDSKSQYGLQIVSTETVENLTIGDDKDESLTVESYNNAIKNLNDIANDYKNNDISTMARSIGSNPGEPDIEGSCYSNILGAPQKSKKYRGSDNNYEEDNKQIEKIDLSVNKVYWLASRDTNYDSNLYSKEASTISFYVRTSSSHELISRMDYSGWTVTFEKTKGVLPVFNLKDNVRIKSGNGTSDSPYELK